MTRPADRRPPVDADPGLYPYAVTPRPTPPPPPPPPDTLWRRWAPVAAMTAAGVLVNALLNWPQSPQGAWPW